MNAVGCTPHVTPRKNITIYRKRHLSCSLDEVHIKTDHLIWLHSNYVRWTASISEVYQIVVYLTLQFAW